MDKVVRIHASSGTTGKPTVVGYTRNDVTIWAECMARSFYNCGVGKHDVIHVAYGYGLFTGGLGAHYGSEMIGAATVPASGGNTARQIQLICDFGTTAICCTPSYALYLADEMKSLGIQKEQLKLKAGLFGAEQWTEGMRAEIEARLNLTAYDIYGLSEIAGPGVANSCEAHDGLHVQSDHFYPEIIDPDTAEVLSDGEEGELVFTCLTKEALPLIRYRTRDLSSLTRALCECGRTTPRMSKVKGRSDDMLIIRGVNVFPSQIESVLLRYDAVEPHYIIYLDRINNLDSMEIHIEINEKIFSDEVRKIETLERRLTADIYSALGVSAKIKLTEPNTIQRSEGKAVRVIDRRALK
jgi:phenylacetate-CoA ligase